MCFYVLFFAIFVVLLEMHMLEQALPMKLDADYCSSSSFREHVITEECYSLLMEQALRIDEEPYKYLTAAFLYENGVLDTPEHVIQQENMYAQMLKNLQGNMKFEEISNVMCAIWKDIKYFPVPASVKDTDVQISFDNSWQFERNYGGTRGHEGCDLMAAVNKRGYYPIISMTDGVVEKIGWLPQGGYRIGIRSPSGAYFYYAHLYEYAEQFNEGSHVSAGQLLGYMGDSGYGEEGTVGKFDVHLHIGIYIKSSKHDEISINPYYVLRYLESNKLNYLY